MDRVWPSNQSSRALAGLASGLRSMVPAVVRAMLIAFWTALSVVGRLPAVRAGGPWSLVLRILFFYLLHGATAEYLFFAAPGYRYSLFTVLFQNTLYAVAAVVLLRSAAGLPSSSSLSSSPSVSPSFLPWKPVVLLCVCNVVGSYLSNLALAYIDYPTKILFKSSKLLAIMIGGMVLFRRKFKTSDFASAALLCAGLFLLSYGALHGNRTALSAAEGGVDLPSSWSGPIRYLCGVLLVAASLAMDSAVGNLQETILQHSRMHPLEVLALQCGVSAVFSLVPCYLTGELSEALHVCAIAYPIRIGLALVLNGLTGFWGVSSYFALVQDMGIVTSQMVATVRKMLTVLLSYLLFPKPFPGSSMLSIFLIFGGSIVHVMGRSDLFGAARDIEAVSDKHADKRVGQDVAWMRQPLDRSSVLPCLSTGTSDDSASV